MFINLDTMLNFETPLNKNNILETVALLRNNPIITTFSKAEFTPTQLITYNTKPELSSKFTPTNYKSTPERYFAYNSFDNSHSLGHLTTIIAGQVLSQLFSNTKFNGNPIEVFEMPNELEFQFNVTPKLLGYTNEINAGGDLILGYRYGSEFVILAAFEIKHKPEQRDTKEIAARNYRFLGTTNIPRFTINFSELFEQEGYKVFTPKDLYDEIERNKSQLMLCIELVKKLDNSSYTQSVKKLKLLINNMINGDPKSIGNQPLTTNQVIAFFQKRGLQYFSEIPQEIVNYILQITK